MFNTISVPYGCYGELMKFSCNFGKPQSQAGSWDLIRPSWFFFFTHHTVRGGVFIANITPEDHFISCTVTSWFRKLNGGIGLVESWCQRKVPREQCNVCVLFPSLHTRRQKASLCEETKALCVHLYSDPLKSETAQALIRVITSQLKVWIKSDRSVAPCWVLTDLLESRSVTSLLFAAVCINLVWGRVIDGEKKRKMRHYGVLGSLFW